MDLAPRSGAEVGAGPAVFLRCSWLRLGAGGGVRWGLAGEGGAWSERCVLQPRGVLSGGCGASADEKPSRGWPDGYDVDDPRCCVD